MLRKIFGPEKDEVAWDGGRLQTEKASEFY